MPIRSTLSDLLTFDITIDNGPIFDNLGIEWSLSISSDLDFNGPSGVAYAQSVSFMSTSAARDIALEDTFAWFFDGPQSASGFAYGTEGESSTYYDSYRGTSVDNYSEGYFYADGSPSVQAQSSAHYDTTLLDYDIIPVIDMGDFIIS